MPNIRIIISFCLFSHPDVQINRTQQVLNTKLMTQRRNTRLIIIYFMANYAIDMEFIVHRLGGSRTLISYRPISRLIQFVNFLFVEKIEEACVAHLFTNLIFVQRFEGIINITIEFLCFFFLLSIFFFLKKNHRKNES